MKIIRRSLIETYLNQENFHPGMALSQARPRRKQTGARYKDYRKKKQFEQIGRASCRERV